MSLFPSTLTGRILDDGVTEPPVIELQGISAGQLATVLTAYTPQTEHTANTAAIGVNAAAIAALQGQVAALPAAPDLAPYALASDLAAAEGSILANASDLVAVNTSLTQGLATKANQSALDALQVEVNGKSTPASVDLKLANHPTTAAMNSSIASANNATLATVATTYALKSVVDQLALDVAARQTAADVDQRVATALLSYLTQTAYQAGQPAGRPTGRARCGHFSSAERRAFCHGGGADGIAGLAAIRHRRDSGGDRHPGRRHQSCQRPRLAGRDHLGPAGRNKSNQKLSRRGSSQHRPGQ